MVRNASIEPSRIAFITILVGLISLIPLPINASDFKLAISNERSNEVLLHDADGKVISTLLHCKRPRGMLTGTVRTDLWVACSDEDSVVRIDTETGEVKQRINGLHGPTNLALSSQGALLISNESSASASLFNSQTGQLISNLPTGFEPDGVAISESRQRIFVASENAGLVHVFSSQDFREETPLLTNLRPRRLALLGDELWVSSEMGSRVEIFSAESLKKIDEIIFSPRGFRSEQLTPVDILFSNNGQYAFVALGAANHVAIVDVGSREIEEYILVGRRAWGLALSPEGKRLYVLNGLSDDMTIIDLESRRPIASVRTGLAPHAVEVIEK